MDSPRRPLLVRNHNDVVSRAGHVAQTEFNQSRAECLSETAPGRRNVSKSGTARVEKRAPKARGSTRRGRWGGGSWVVGVPLPSRLGGLGNVVSSPSGVRGRAPAANAFLIYLEPQNDAGGDKNSGNFYY